ncbi:MAG: Mov34/MPN/PAD-1 family protein [Kofleriaceae bacterium]
MIGLGLALAWPALVAAVEASADETAGWVAAAAPVVRVATLDGDGRWSAAAHVALATAALRGPAPLALFHSHPDGRAAVSARDLAAWAPTGRPLWRWPQVIVATRGGRAVAAVVAAWPVGAPGPVTVARLRRAAAVDGAGWGLA